MNWPIYGYSGVPSSEQLINEFLLQAENRYGPRSSAVTFTGENTPPGGAIDVIFNPGRTHGRVRIPAGLQEYDRHRQLAHESIPVLSPADQTDATILDEGVAWYSPSNFLNTDPRMVCCSGSIPRPSQWCRVYVLCTRTP
jgi:hypothetical protein